MVDNRATNEVVTTMINDANAKVRRDEDSLRAKMSDLAASQEVMRLDIKCILQILQRNKGTSNSDTGTMQTVLAELGKTANEEVSGFLKCHLNNYCEIHGLTITYNEGGKKKYARYPREAIEHAKEAYWAAFGGKK